MDMVKEEEFLSEGSPSPSSAAEGSSKGTPAPSTEASSSNANSTSILTPTTSAPSSASASRRPPRKSTLTQQQKNQKRQRATQDQLATLELEFAKNPTPTAQVRERIAQEINMTERSVQIWFQNRRAKIKLIHKKSIETGEDIDQIPDSMRQYLFHQAQEAGKPFPAHLLGRSGGGMAYGSGTMFMNAETANSGKVVIQHFTCRSLSIGSWRRVGQNAMDLVIFYSPDKACMTYYINNDSAGYKIEYPFSFIKHITLESGDPPNPNGTPGKPGGLLVELTRPPRFFMDSSGQGGFYECGDFTEDQQASQVMFHHLGGNPKVLSGQLAKLVSLDSFRNRFSPFDMNALPASAPVSPTFGPIRPASQPNQLAHTQPHVGGMFQENLHFSMNHLQPGRPAPGHKRTRSRSVPVAVDFSMLRNPAPSVHVQRPSTDFIPDPNLFAPMPQTATPGPIGPNLRIDTSSGYGMDWRQYPMSAATTASPSDYASPSFFTQAPSDMMPASLATPYSLPFLSPSPVLDPSGMNMQPSQSPLSNVSHHDPVIADQSPPLSGLPRPASADMFAFQPDHPSNMSDDGNMLSEMYSKQNLNMPMPSPGMPVGDPMMAMSIADMGEQGTQGLDLPGMMPFGTIDPSSLSNNPSRPGTGTQ